MHQTLVLHSILQKELRKYIFRWLVSLVGDIIHCLAKVQSGSGVLLGSHVRDYYYLVWVEVNKSCSGIKAVPDDECNKLRPITARLHFDK